MNEGQQAHFKICVKCEHLKANKSADYIEYVCSLVYEPVQIAWKKIDWSAGLNGIGFYYKPKSYGMSIPFHCPFTLEQVMLSDKK